ncbi:MAG: class I SAM-dependent methyltransferase [Actinobacteria bacterium]|nr:class I SAM-dependent methyltransferase [Actinomycetota bacterium]
MSRDVVPDERDGALRYYDQADLWGDDELSAMERERVAETLAAIPDGVATVLDVGCGDGRLTNRLVARHERVVGVDIAAEALRHVAAETHVAPVTALPFEDRAFELVLCTEVLEHLDDEQLACALRELSRVASRFVLVSVPFEESLANAEGRCPDCRATFHVFRHHQRFDAARLAQLVPGFSLARWSTFGPAFLPPRPLDVWIQHRLLGSWHHSAAAVCPRCGHRGTEPSRRRALARGVRATRRLPPGRRKRQWLLALYARA